MQHSIIILLILMHRNHTPWSFTWFITNYNTETILGQLLKTHLEPKTIWLFQALCSNFRKKTTKYQVSDSKKFCLYTQCSSGCKKNNTSLVPNKGTSINDVRFGGRQVLLPKSDTIQKNQKFILVQNRTGVGRSKSRPKNRTSFMDGPLSS